MPGTGDPIAYHITTRLRDDRVIAPTVELRRLLASVVLWQSRHEHLLGFSAPDTHLHMLLVSGRAAAGKLAHRVESAAKQRLRLKVGFSRAEYQPVRDQAHLRNAFIYILRQYERHGVLSDPCHEASNMPDLLGMRVTGQHTVGNVRSFLPRISRADLLPFLGVEDPRDGTPSAEHVGEAAAAAVCMSSLGGNSRRVVMARTAAVKVAVGVIRGVELARHLGVSTRSVRRAVRRPVDERLVQAVHQQAVLRGIVDQRAEGVNCL